MKLTAMEKAIVRGHRDSEYNDGGPSYSIYVFSLIDNSGLDSKQARGAMASLVKKGLGYSDYDSTTGETMFSIENAETYEELLSD